MTHDALFARINGALSAFWGGIFAVSGLALLLGHTLRHLDTENRQQRATDVGHPAPRSGARAEDAGLCAARAPRQRAAQASNYA
jgi:hypothetical protein